MLRTASRLLPTQTVRIQPTVATVRSFGSVQNNSPGNANMVWVGMMCGGILCGSIPHGTLGPDGIWLTPLAAFLGTGIGAVAGDAIYMARPLSYTVISSVVIGVVGSYYLSPDDDKYDIDKMIKNDEISNY